MARETGQIELDAAVWRRLDVAARTQGRTRDEVLEESVRRTLAAQDLEDVLARVRGRGTLDEAEALAVANEERQGWHDQRRARRSMR